MVRWDYNMRMNPRTDESKSSLTPTGYETDGLIDDRLIPARHVQEEEYQTQKTAADALPLRLLQLFWVLLLGFVIVRTISNLVSFEQLVSQTKIEWIVQESTRGLNSIDPRSLALIIIFSEFWTFVISISTAVLIFWRKRNEGMPLYVAYMLLIVSFGVRIRSNPGPIDEIFTFSSIGLFLLFPFIFPDGRIVPRSWKNRILLVGALMIIPFLFFSITKILNPELGGEELGYPSFIFAIVTILIAGAICQIYRYSKLSDPAERGQMRWVIIGFGFLVAWFMWVLLWLGFLESFWAIPDSYAALFTILFSILATTFFPVSLVVSILHDRLWQIEVVLNRTLVYGGLTAMVIFLYIIVVGFLGTLFQSGNNLYVSVVATGLIAILFNPLRERLQQNVNRLMYGQRDDPLTILVDLGKQMESISSPGESLPVLVNTIGLSLKLPYVAVVSSENEILAAVGTNQKHPQQSYPLIYQAQTIGHLQVVQRSVKEQFSPDEDHLLRNVARQASAAVHAYLLTNQLQRSRERLVSAREEERRRLRRDLHDGLGPQLATMSFKASAAQNLMESNPQQAEKLLAEITKELQEAVEEIRTVVEGLRPSALDQLGFLSSLQEFAAQHGLNRPKIIITAPAQMPPLPAAVEVAAYRIATEAMNNCLRHAQAEECTVQLAVGEALYLQINDDGSGLSPAFRPGVGLTSMAERAEELGGTFELISSENGVQITAVLPL